MKDDCQSDVRLAQSIAAAMQLRLPGTAGRVGRKMRYIDEVAPHFRGGGAVRAIPSTLFEQLWTVGVATASNSIPAFGGVLYGAVALRQDVTVQSGKAKVGFQDSQVDVADMTFVQVANRLIWKQYHLAYQILEDLFNEATLPDLILMDRPLLVMRGLQAGALVDEEVREEWEDLLALLTRFWGRYAAHCYPVNPKGPTVAYIGQRHFGAILTAIQKEGLRGSVDPITPELSELVTKQWDDLRRVGVDRILRGLLRPGTRTAAYLYTAMGRDALRAAPKMIGEQGLLGWHMQVGHRTPIWQVEVLGPADHWQSEALDRIAAMLAYLTLYDNPQALPLPLWHAMRLASVPEKLLRGYRASMTQMLRDQSVEQAWLEGVDQFADETGGAPTWDNSLE
ncbi:MAG: hypothetical protein IPM39_19405 [Chloroflexi bacterium]|nr:hypothetical protein [Chloroflexota bacterium]